MEGSRKCWVLNGLETDSESEIDGHLDVKIIGKKLYYTFDFLIFTEKRGLFILSLGTFGKVGPFFGQDEILDDTNTKNIFKNSGSNETMQV